MTGQRWHAGSRGPATRGDPLGAALRGLKDPATSEASYRLVTEAIMPGGAIVPATGPALEEVAAIATDPSTPDRLGLLWLITAAGLSLRERRARWAGAEVTTASPPARGSASAEWERGTLECLLRALAQVTPLSEDPDPQVRSAFALLVDVARLLSPPGVPAPALSGALAALERRWASEQEATARAAILTALIRAGQLPSAERSAAADDVDPLIAFAARWAQASGDDDATGREQLVADADPNVVRELRLLGWFEL